MKTILSKIKKWKSKKAAADLISIIVSVVLIAALVLGIMLFISNKVRQTAQDEVNNIMNSITGIAEANRNNTDISIPGGPGGEPIIPPESETIYYANINTGTVYDAMPATVSDGDVYLHGDYIYFYSPSTLEINGWLIDLAEIESEESLVSSLEIETLFPDYEWTDRNQTSYGEILSSVNGINVIDVSYAFYDCTALEKAPAIPSSVTNMEGTFECCSSLSDVSDLIIPSSVTNMSYTFHYCTALTEAPDMSNANSVTDMEQTFADCTELEKAPSIPSNVTNMHGIFYNCTSLTDVSDLVIPSSVTYMTYTFEECTSLTDVSDLVIPSSVISMEGTFKGCTGLTEAPVIPNSVTNMFWTFYGCTSLEKAPAIPNSVTDMGGTFYGCINLTGNIEINANPSEYYQCFKGTTKPITITGSTTLKAELAATANNGNVTY